VKQTVLEGMGRLAGERAAVQKDEDPGGDKRKGKTRWWGKLGANNTDKKVKASGRGP